MTVDSGRAADPFAALDDRYGIGELLSRDDLVHMTLEPPRDHDTSRTYCRFTLRYMAGVRQEGSLSLDVDTEPYEVARSGRLVRYDDGTWEVPDDRPRSGLGGPVNGPGRF